MTVSLCLCHQFLNSISYFCLDLHVEKLLVFSSFVFTVKTEFRVDENQ